MRKRKEWESDSSAKTPLGKRKHETDYAFFPTPVRRKILAEDPTSSIGFVGDTSHIQLFVNQTPQVQYIWLQRGLDSC